MAVVWFVSGLLLVALVYFDALWTTVWPEGGAGPLTDRVTGGGWKVAKVFARDGQGEGEKFDHKRLAAAGPIIAVGTVLTWFTLMYVGYFLMFSSTPSAVVDATTEATADLSDRVWYSLYVMSTLGNGDFKPDTALFQLVSGAASLGGISLVTLAITYVLQVLDAVVHKRSFAHGVFSLGENPTEVARALGRGPDTEFGSQLGVMAEQLATMTEQHKAFPILHYFHPGDRRRSAAVAVVVLDEALLLQQAGDSDSRELAVSASIQPLRRTIASFLESLRGDYFGRAAESPPTTTDVADDQAQEPSKIASTDNIERLAEETSDRRRLLSALLDHNGWRWADISSAA